MFRGGSPSHPSHPPSTCLICTFNRNKKKKLRFPVYMSVYNVRKSQYVCRIHFIKRYIHYSNIISEGGHYRAREKGSRSPSPPQNHPNEIARDNQQPYFVREAITRNIYTRAYYFFRIEKHLYLLNNKYSVARFIFRFFVVGFNSVYNILYGKYYQNPPEIINI